MRNIIDGSRVVASLLVFVVVVGGVWAAIHGVGADRRLEGSVEHSDASVDTLPVPGGAGTSEPLQEFADELGDCRTAVGSREEARRSIGRARRDASGRNRHTAERELQKSVGACAGVVYAWSTSMPLSGRGIVEISKAARRLGVALHVLNAAELYARENSEFNASLGGESMDAAGDLEHTLTDELVGKGMTVHYPAIMVYRDGRFLGDAVVGYKTAAAYEALIAKRLALRTADGGVATDEATPRAAAGASSRPEATAAASRRVMPGPDGGSIVEDIRVTGRPGPYFRFVRGRGAIAFESGRVIYLLDLAAGTTQGAPGFVDFVPAPDGRFFVTPAEGRDGLEFYDAAAVFDAASRDERAAVQPFYVDREMRDQYPSVGVLDSAREAGATRFAYRVLTSWFDKVMFRDYEMRSAAGEPPAVQPLAGPVVACPNRQVSLPIMAQDGRELAARDEATATTKILSLSDDGTCTERLDTGLQTGKVAWAADGRRIAFAIPRGVVSDGKGALWRGIDRGGERAGIFVLDRDDLRLTRVAGSGEVNRLAFPEFVGRDSVMFLLSSQAGSPSRFRLTCCVR